MELNRRLEKFRRLTRWWLADAGVPMWWHVGRPNFGDDITPTFFRAVGGLPVRYAADRRAVHLLGAGSILEKAAPTSIVCGSGFLSPTSRPPSPLEIVAVRGERSLAVIRGPDSTLRGDPLVLVGDFVGPAVKKHRCGLVPHVRSIARWRAANRGRHLLIDPGLEPWRVVEAIGSCETVLSQSLHGLIVADALGVPNVWISPSDAMVGGRFKFDDYFSTLDAAKECIPETDEIFRNPQVYAVTVGHYRHCKEEYRRALSAACRRSLGTAVVAA